MKDYFHIMPFGAQGLLSFFTDLFIPFSVRKPARTPYKLGPSHTVKPKSHHYENAALNKAILNTEDMYACQSEALLLSRLPVEIRNLIWMHVLGNNTIHFFYEGVPEVLCACVCGKQVALSCESLAHGGKGLKKLPKGEDKDVLNLGCMGVLTSCRALYFETTQILYSRNTFDFSDCWATIGHLPWLLPLSSLSQISSVTVNILDLYNAPNCVDIAAWKGLWYTLGLLRGLKELKVEIAIKEKLEKATIKKADLVKIEQELLGHLKMQEDIPGRRKAEWEIVFPCDPEEEESQAAKELVQNGWKLTRI